MKKIFLLLLFFISSFSSFVFAQRNSESDSLLVSKSRMSLQGIYLYSFAKNIYWPRSDSTGDFTIGIYESKDLFDHLTTKFNDKYKGNQKIIFKLYNSNLDTIDCHLLSIPSGFDLSKIKPKVNRNRTLLVGENYSPSELDICFLYIESKLKFRLNTSFEERGFKIGQIFNKLAYEIISEEEYTNALNYINNKLKNQKDGEVVINTNTLNKIYDEVQFKETKIQDQKKIQNLTNLILLLVLFFLAFSIYTFIKVRNSRNLISSQKYDLEIKNKEIEDSISYAKRIQTAILPSSKIVRQYLKDSFIYYLPKDIVAGDFYWMETVGKKTLFAAADCTGHGVPGAMVSVICNSCLNKSVLEFKLTDPGEILDKTRELVLKEFEKSEEEISDGMDIAICSLEEKKENYELKFAGANNPLWLIRGGVITDIKGNRQPIGKSDKKENFKTEIFQLSKGDSFYIFSDGYVDQFGGEKGKKYKSAPFKKYLLSINNETMDKQKELIAQNFKNWMGDYEQIDDVCVIGVKV
tara:strand:- start:58 stop:1623 length:1566 start_codon:yes stop_codon:yes gene_type:complete